MDHKRLEACAGNFNLHSASDLYYAIYCKSLTLQHVIEKLTHQKAGSTNYDNQEMIKLFSNKDIPAKKKNISKYGISVAGIDSMLISLASCCSPIPGDEIVGFVTKGQGVKVHRKDCPNVNDYKERLIDVEWEEDFEHESNYEVNLVIHSTDRNYLLSDIVTVTSQCKVGLRHVDSKVNDDGINATTKLSVLVKNAEHLHALIANLRKITSVANVVRVIL